MNSTIFHDNFIQNSSGAPSVGAMNPKPALTSLEWIRYFQENARTAEARQLPEVQSTMSMRLCQILSASLPVRPFGEILEGAQLRKNARQYAQVQHDPAFLNAVELFISEEQRHRKMLDDWLDLVEIPRRNRHWGDRLFRFCRDAIPQDAVWTSVVMAGTAAEIYYSAVRRMTACPRLRAECSRILADKVRHIQFLCEHLATVRRDQPRWRRGLVQFGEILFYAGIIGTGWVAHGRLLREADIPLTHFLRLGFRKYRLAQKMMDPVAYDFDLPGQYEKWRRRLLTATD